MIDFILIIAYLSMLGATRLAAAPALAFIATVLIYQLGLEMALQHTLYILTYILCAPFTSVKIGYAMLASAVVNLLSVAYFLLPVYLNSYTAYFIISMLVVNLLILFTIWKGLKNGDICSSGGFSFTRFTNIFNF